MDTRQLRPRNRGSATPMAPDAIAGLELWLRADSNVFTPDGTEASLTVDSVGSSEGTLTGFSTQEKLDAWSIDRPTALKYVTRYSLELPGTDARSAFTEVNLGTTHSVSFWLKGSFENAAIVAGATNYIVSYWSVGNWSYIAGVGNVALASMEQETTSWHHMVVVRSGTTVSFFRDTVQITTVQNLSTNTAMPVSAIGSYADGTGAVTGNLADVQVYSTALNAGHIAECYAGGTATGATLTHRWMFDDGPPVAAAADDEVLHRITDKSANAYSARQHATSIYPTLRAADINGEDSIELIRGDHFVIDDPVCNQPNGLVSAVVTTGTAFIDDQAIWSTSNEADQQNWMVGGIDGTGRPYRETDVAGTMKRMTATTPLRASTSYHIEWHANGILVNGSTQAVSSSDGIPGWFSAVVGRTVFSIGALRIIEEAESRDWHIGHCAIKIAEFHAYDGSVSSAKRQGLWLTMATAYGLSEVAAPTAYANGRLYRRTITLNLPETVTLPAGTQVEILLNRGNCPDLFAVDSTGASVLFTTTAGANLEFFTTDWDATNGQASYFVAGPQQVGPTTTNIYLYYGMTGAVSASDYDAAMVKLPDDAATEALWHFDEGTGTSLLDVTEVYTATLTGTWVTTDGGNCGTMSPRRVFTVGKCVQLGTDKQVEIPSLLDTPPAAGTVEFWFRVDGAIAGGVLYCKSGLETEDAEEYFGLQFTEGSPALNLVATNAGTTATYGPNAGTWPVVWTSGNWYHIVHTWGPLGHYVWVNGNLHIHTTTTTMSAGGTARAFYLGATKVGGTLSGFVNGTFDELRVLNVQANYSRIVRDFWRCTYTSGQKSQQDRWTISANSPIMTGTVLSIDDHTVEPVMRKVDTTWNLWVTGADSTLEAIYRATSANGETLWTPIGKVIGQNTGGEAGTAAGHFIMADGATWYHFYRGAFPSADIEYATSPDNGQTLTRQGVAIAHDAQSWIGAIGLGEIGIELDGHLYRGRFSGHDGTEWANGIALAYSLGGQWMLDPDNDYADARGTNSLASRSADHQSYLFTALDPAGASLPTMGFFRVATTHSGLHQVPFDNLISPIVENAFSDLVLIQDQSGTDLEFWTDGSTCRMAYTVGNNLPGPTYYFRIYLLKYASTVENLVSLPSVGALTLV